MSKKFLVLGAVVTTLVLLFAACAQPTELDGASININNYGVEPPKNVKAVAYTGAVRLTWEASKSSVSGYRIIRQRTDTGEEPVVIGSASITNNILNTWYVDTTLTGLNKLENGVKYIYSVVAYQSVSGDGVGAATAESAPAEEVTANIPASGTILPNPRKPGFDIVSSVQQTSGDPTDLNFDYIFKISGLNPAYTYSFKIQSWTPAVAGPPAVAGYWTDEGNPIIASSTGNPDINLTLNAGTYEDVGYVSRTISRVQNVKYRVVVTYNVASTVWTIKDTVDATETDTDTDALNEEEVVASLAL